MESPCRTCEYQGEDSPYQSKCRIRKKCPKLQQFKSDVQTMPGITGGVVDCDLEYSVILK